MELTHTNAENVARLDRTIPDAADHALALAHAPRIRFDRAEPFLPFIVGYSVFRQDGASSSFPRRVTLAGAATCAIEYAIWWDWDIQHLYELEHAWVYLDDEGHLVDAEASWHGGYHRMADENGVIPVADGRLLLHSEPGKHAFAPSPQWLQERRQITESGCTIHSGIGGVWVTPLFEGTIKERNPFHNQLVRTYLERHAFQPTYDFSQVFALESAIFVPWAALHAWIPQRIRWWVAELERTIPPAERRVLRIAHRGASAHAQENSLEALQMAAKLGSDMVEVDVRISADQEPVIAHDESLKRLYGIDALVSDLTLKELKAQTPILTMAETAQVCRGLHLGLYLDVKVLTPAAAERMFAALDEANFTSFAIFASFRPDLLAEIKAHRPNVVTSVLFASAHIDPVLLARAVQADYVHPCWEHSTEQPHRLLTPEWLQAVRQAGLGVITWHEERPQEIAALKALGVSGICSDQPELLV
jgi:glycerophosphoryl diester phosphodiesterase